MRRRLPGSIDRWLAIAVAALPALVIGVLLLVPGLRLRLLGPALPPAPVLTTSPLSPLAGPVSGRVQPVATIVEPTIDDRPPSTPSAATVATAAPATAAGPTPVVVTGAAASAIVESAYRAYLPASVGPLRTSLSGGQLGIEAEVDLGQLGGELQAPVPEFLTNLLGGKATIRLATRIVGSRDGVVSLRLDKVSIGAIPLPEVVLRRFMAGEIEARGYVVGDPLVRNLRLPPGIATAVIEGDHLVLQSSP